MIVFLAMTPTNIRFFKEEEKAYSWVREDILKNGQDWIDEYNEEVTPFEMIEELMATGDTVLSDWEAPDLEWSVGRFKVE